MRFEIETVDGHLTFPGASVDAPGSYGEAESLGFFFAGREKVLFSDKGAEGGDAGSFQKQARISRGASRRKT